MHARTRGKTGPRNSTQITPKGVRACSGIMTWTRGGPDSSTEIQMTPNGVLVVTLISLCQCCHTRRVTPKKSILRSRSFPRRCCHAHADHVDGIASERARAPRARGNQSPVRTGAQNRLTGVGYGYGWQRRRLQLAKTIETMLTTSHGGKLERFT